jgi:hypothetical protein
MTDYVWCFFPIKADKRRHALPSAFITKLPPNSTSTWLMADCYSSREFMHIQRSSGRGKSAQQGRIYAFYLQSASTTSNQFSDYNEQLW